MFLAAGILFLVAVTTCVIYSLLLAGPAGWIFLAILLGLFFLLTR